MKDKRFEITETEGGVKGLYVIVDKETGVNYLMQNLGLLGDYAHYLIRTVSRLSADSKTKYKFHRSRRSTLRSIPVKQQITGLQKMSVPRRIMIVNWPVDKSSFKGDTHK